MTEAGDAVGLGSAHRLPATALVAAAIVSVQFGGALAATLLPKIGPAGAVTLRLLFSTAILLLIARPKLTGHSRRAWATVIGFGISLGLMNFFFYASLVYLPIGVAVTIEFLGPLLLAASLSRRLTDLLAVCAAGFGVMLISRVLSVSPTELSWTGIVLAAAAGACWAAYIVLSEQTGRVFDKLQGLTLAMVIASVITVPFGLGSAPQWDSEVLGKALGIALLSSVVPYSLELFALRRMRPRVFGILLSLEPAVAAGAGFLVLSERLSIVQLVGMTLVVLASAVVVGLGRRRDPAEAGP